MKTVKNALTRRLRSNLLKKACFSLTCDLLLCVGERLFSTSLKAIESIFKVGIVGLRGLSLYDNSRDIDIVVKLEEGGRDLDLHLYSFFFFSYCFCCKIQSQKMQSIASVVGATLTGKDTYLE